MMKSLFVGEGRSLNKLQTFSVLITSQLSIHVGPTNGKNRTPLKTNIDWSLKLFNSYDTKFITNEYILF